MTDLRALRVFAAVARNQSFSRAADELHVSQQAVSRTVARLEDELRIRLLDRTTRAVVVTPAGAALAGDAERILTDVDVALERARDIGRGGAGGTIRLAATPAISGHELQAAVRALRADVQGVAVLIDRIRPRRVAAALAAGEIDVVLGRTASASDGIEVRRVGGTPAAVALAAGHPLAGREALALDDLAGERLVVWNRTSTYTEMLVGVFADAGVAVEPVESSVVGSEDQPDVAAGVGVALVAGTTPAPTGVVLVPLRDRVELPVTASWRRWGAPPLAARFVAAAESALGA
ncbi:MAG: LysR family transcriptional regulator [Solirubrobacteraceae bacterium]